MTGVVVTSVMTGSEGAELGFVAGDVVTRVHGTEIHSLDDVRRAMLEAQSEGRHYVLLLTKGRRQRAALARRPSSPPLLMAFRYVTVMPGAEIVSASGGSACGQR